MDAVDTTAAGDSFTAALAVMLAKGKSLSDAAVFANYVSAIAVTRKGAQSSIPTLDEVREYIERFERDKEAVSLAAAESDFSLNLAGVTA